MSRQSKAKIDLVVILLLSAITFICASYFNVFERFATWSQQHERFDIDELVILSIILVFGLGGSAYRRWSELEKSERELQEKNRALTAAMAEIKILKGILPICSYCKKIRNGQGDWQPIESYIHKHSQAEFSHSICPECGQKHYPEIWKRLQRTEEESSLDQK